MKARPNPLSLVLTISFFALLAIMVARADHTTGVMEGAPEPVQECYATAQIYQQLIITRQAGLSQACGNENG